MQEDIEQQLKEREELARRFPPRTSRWGTRKRQFTLRLEDPNHIVLLEERARQLTATLGYNVNRHHVVEDLIHRDPDLQAIEKDLNEGR